MSGRNYFVFAAMSILLFTSMPMMTNAATIGGRFYPVITDSKTTPQPIDNLVGHYDRKINFIFSDIDGTMLPFNKASKMVEFPESVGQAVKKLHDRQIPLVLATGRSYGEARDVAHRIGNENTYLITQQGAQIINPQGEFIYQDNIKKSDVPKIIKSIEACEKLNKTTFDVAVFTEKDTYATKNTALPCNWEKVNIVKSFKELYNSNICKITISEQNPQKLRIIQEYLQKAFPQYNVVLSGEFYCDLSSKTATKGNAIKKLSKILDVDLKHAAVLGDAENDISMFKFIRKNGGIAIATGNAMAETKYNANYITSTVFAGGFAKAIDKILLNNAKIMLSKDWQNFFICYHTNN